MNKDLEERYLSVIEDNVNVGKTSDGKEFFILLAGIVGICIGVYLLAGVIANIWIDRMTIDTQVKIEKVLASKCLHKDQKHDSLEYLESVKSKIIAMDENLQGKSEFPLHIEKEDFVNAYIAPDGTIHFTSELLKEVTDKEALTFVLAHELAHYAHRDHLKSIGRELIAGAILTILSGGQSDGARFVSTVSQLTSNQYSQQQEKAADLYANDVVIKLYGKNDGAVKFFELLKEKEKFPEFLFYFSTHPPTSNRIKLIKNAK